MRARVGDWLVVHSRRVDDGDRKGLILEVAHPDGSPPYVVRWLDDDHSSVVFPGSDATVLPGTRHAPEPAGGAATGRGGEHAPLPVGTARGRVRTG